MPRRYRRIAKFAQPIEPAGNAHPEGKPIQELLILQDVLLPVTYFVKLYATEVYVEAYMTTPTHTYFHETFVPRIEWDQARFDLLDSMVSASVRELEQHACDQNHLTGAQA